MTASKTKVQQPDTLLVRFQEFVRLEASSGVLLMLAAIVALFLANSVWSRDYFAFFNAPISIGIGNTHHSESLLFWINDALMAIFFFVVGLEIKREVIAGELSHARQAALPIAAAIGGMVVPALLYALVAAGRPEARGWGIPMATDIAFALGILALLGNRVPIGLKIFLTALAIVDDIGAILVIAVFYSHQINVTAAVAAVGFMLALLLCNRLGLRHPAVYGLLGIGLWFAVFGTGIHATVTGVLVAMTIPSRSRITTHAFWEKAQTSVEHFRAAHRGAGGVLFNEPQYEAVQELERICESVDTPLQRFERGLHSWVVYGIMPLFALANAGVVISLSSGLLTADRVALGVAVGLVLGKPLGIVFASWLAVRLGMAELPKGTTWRHILGAGCLGGIGFTMSLLISSLAFQDATHLSGAKIGILGASVIASVLGWLLLARAKPARA